MLIPDHETATDFLNYEAISRTVIELLKNNSQQALSVGIHGDWGAGKSSILKMIESGLCQDERVACLWFNGWEFQGFDDAKAVLIESTITELSRQRPNVDKVKELSTRLIKRVDWLKWAKRGSGIALTLTTGLPSPDQIEAVVGNLKSLIGNPKAISQEEIQAKLEEAMSSLKPAEDAHVTEQIHQFREDFGNLLAEAKIDRLVVLIDDLDRCLPTTAIDTLEAIRLFLFVPRTAFVIGADEAMIEYAVRQHFPELPAASGPMPYARNYLEKLIQVPFRIPTLGIQETTIYVTLLLIESLVGTEHEGFQQLLRTAKTSLNKPWLGSGIRSSDVEAVEAQRKTELGETYVLSQQIGPILAEGSKGNPRQIKRFLNSLLIRHAIADAQGFGDSINQAVLAKLMLAERFQPDFYEYIAGRVMVAKEGAAEELRLLEEKATREDNVETSAKKDKNGKETTIDLSLDEATKQWLEREWLKRWLRIEPALAGRDLRPYVFIARDKRMIVVPELGDLDRLIENLCGPEIAVRSVEPEVKALSENDADQVFVSLRERVLSQGDFTAQPSGFHGMSIVAKHHPIFQSEVLSVLDGIADRELGIWVVRGWNEILTESAARERLHILMSQWATQDENSSLKKAAELSLSSLSKGTG
ncbi:MAG: P-loop NTPase fold protein [Gemmatimonadota bacterium]|nr:P-loop NTPase fold protein [Gemmatimonadota bacterium]